MMTRSQSFANSITARLNGARQKLSDAMIESSSLDARILMKHALGCGDEFILGNPEYTIDSHVVESFEKTVDRRLAHEPISKIIGEREFWGLSFLVTKDTLDPRADSETLIESVLEFIPDLKAPLRILDLGTGTGCLLLSLLSELTGAQGVGIDCCPKALEIAKLNAKRLGLDNRVELLQGDWGQNLKAPFDIIVSNPPYIASDEIANLSREVKDYDPLLALTGGGSGLKCYQEIMPQIRPLLAPGGIVAFEIGLGQEQKVRNIMTRMRLNVMKSIPDLAGIPRCLLANVIEN